VTVQISAEEFGSRRAEAARRAAERGLSGLVVFSRGGTTLDYYGDVMYLANFHSTFPPISDAPTWAGRGHAALVLPVDGPSVLITDYLNDSDDRAEVDDVRVELRVPKAIGRVLRELELDGSALGLVGAESITLRWFDQLQEGAGRALDIIPADDILFGLRLIKSETELALMHEAAAVGVDWMNTSMNAAAEGRTDAEVVGEGLRHLASRGGTHADVAIASGPRSRHLFSSSGIPHWANDRPMRLGDLVHVDQWGVVNGYFTDFGRSTVIGRNPTEAQREVLEASVALVDHIIEAVRPGATCDELYRRGESWLIDNGFGAPELGLFGHCLGLSQEAPWIVPGETTPLAPNMVVAIEAFVGRSEVGASNCEQNLIVRDDTPEILTAACPQRWWS